MISKDLLSSIDLKVLAIQRTKVGQWWNYSHVISPFSRLWLIVEGNARVCHHDKSFLLKQGRLHLIPAFSIHDCTCSSYLDHFHLHFAARLPTGIDLFSLLDCDFHIHAPATSRGAFERLEAIYPDRKLPCFNPFREEYKRFPKSIEAEEDKIPIAEWFDGQAILRQLLVPFLRTARSREGAHVRATDRFLAVQEYIHENMKNPITLADMARVAGLHPTYFSDRFHELVGVRPSEYLMRRRIERAQYLLLTTRASVKEVAYEVGISDPAYFTRVFVRLCKSSPTDYRAAHSL